MRDPPNSWAGCTVECQEMQPLQNSHPLTIFLRIKENRQFPSALNGCFSGFMQPPLFIYFYAGSDCCVYRSKMSRADKRFAVIGAGSTDSIKSSVFVWFWLKIKSNLWKEKGYLCYLGRDPEEESSFFGGGIKLPTIQVSSNYLSGNSQRWAERIRSATLELL